MAPKKQLLKEVESATQVNPTAEVATARRFTRSLTRRSDPDPAAAPQQPPKKKPRKQAKREVASSQAQADANAGDIASEEGSEIVDEKGSDTNDIDSGSASVSGSKTDDVGASGSGSGSGSRTIIIERCTQCTQFKKRAELVKEGLEKAIPGIIVLINPEKPRRGCFEIREEGKDEKFVSLLGLKRPFKPMRDLDMDQLIAEIVTKLQA